MGRLSRMRATLRSPLEDQPGQDAQGTVARQGQKKQLAVWVRLRVVFMHVCWPCDIDSHAIYALILTWITRACVVSCTYIYVYTYIYTPLLWVCPFLAQVVSSISSISKLLSTNAFWSGGREHVVLCHAYARAT